MEHGKHAVSDKIRKVMHEGVRGKKVSQKQAVAIALSMKRKGKLGDQMKKLKKRKGQKK